MKEVSTSIQGLSLSQSLRSHHSVSKVAICQETMESSSDVPAILTEVTNIYQQYEPSKIDQLPKLFKKFNGKEQELLKMVRRKYLKAESSHESSTDSIDAEAVSNSASFRQPIESSSDVLAMLTEVTNSSEVVK